MTEEMTSVESANATLSSADFEAKFSQSLETGDILSAIVELQKEENQSWIREHGWDKLVPIISTQITADNWKQFPQIVIGCEDLLCKIAERSKPKEILISLAEQCEAFSDDVRYRHVLPAIATAFEMWDVSLAASKVWKWILELLVSHLHAAVLPDVPVLEGKERLTLDADPLVVESCQSVRAFLELLNRLAVMVETRQDLDGGLIQCRGHLVGSVVNILARPLAYFPMDANLKSSAVSESRGLATDLVAVVRRLVPNPIHILTIKACTNYFCLETPKERDYNPATEIRWSRGIGILFYLIFDDPAACSYVPSAYSPFFLFNQLLGNINLMLFDDENYLLHLKALSLVRQIMISVPKNSQSAEILNLGIHTEFLRGLFKAIVYHASEEVRKLAFTQFEVYVGLFTLRARYRLTLFILKVANHSGLIGRTIDNTKYLIVNCLMNKTDIPEEFCGGSLHALVRMFCHLKHGEESDMLEISEEVLASLNFIIGVLMCDKENKTQLREMIPELQAGYLQQLQRALQMSVAHYRARLSQEPMGTDLAESTVTVGGLVLPIMDQQELQGVLQSALARLDLISSNLARLNDVVDRLK